jgi:exosortase/archaeosortase family protein
MNLFKRLWKYFLDNRPFSYFIIMLLVFFFYPRNYFDYVLQIPLIKNLIHQYSVFLYQAVKFLDGLLGIDISNAKIVSKIDIDFIDLRYMSLWYTFLFIAIVLILVSDQKKKLLYVSIGVLLIILLNILRIAFLTLAVNDDLSVMAIFIVRKLIQLFLECSLVVLIFIFIRSNFSFKKLLIKNFSLERAYIRYVLIAMLVCFLGFMGISFLIDLNIIHIRHYLQTGILKIAGFFLAFIGYSPSIAPRHFLRGDNVAVGIGYVCVGVNLMLLYASVIVISGGRVVHQVLFILFGCAAIYLINVMRISLLYIYAAHGIRLGSFMTVHEIFNFLVYFLVFLMWILWFNKFWNKGIVSTKY